MEFLVDPADVGDHRVAAHPELLGHLLVHGPGGEQVEHLPLAGREFEHLVALRERGDVHRGVTLERAHDAAGHHARHRRAPLHHVADRGEQLVDADRLDEIAVGPGREGVEEDVAVLVEREHHELGARHGRRQRPHAVHARAVGEVDVDEHHLRRGRGQAGHRLGDGAVLADAAAVVGALDDLPEARPGAGVVFDEGHADRLGRPLARGRILDGGLRHRGPSPGCVGRRTAGGHRTARGR